MRESLEPAIVAAHAAAEAAGHPGYLDPHTGWFVMTSAALSDRGHCCGNGCRHCPYPPEAQARAGRPDHTP